MANLFCFLHQPHLTNKRKSFIFHEINIYLWNIYREFIPTFCLYLQNHEI